ncbi:MAG: SCO family protein [Bacteroidetes bacterium]|nr:MAG: SCO family protein [Bacteroidota bacterium]MBL1143327.1 SCO family protein [Bacteroidota bacterium]MCB0801620.1 SCO family protein [Flavobacteriales bacterium]NOG56129.1 SCO family protein [Bacteroidota bacterium]
MSQKTIKKGVILVSILLLPSLLYLLLYTGENNFKRPQFYGPKVVSELNNSDTIYHKIPDFKFVNQNGDTVTQDDYRGKIYVADFFFATCPTICPQMATHMLEVQKHFYDRKDFALLSHTVNPEHDTVAVLKAYSEKVHANDDIWSFVTGPKEELYDIAFKGYFVNALPDEIAPGGFLHSQFLILVDKKGHIRGYFDGTSTTEVNSLFDAIEILYKEEFAPLK